MAGALLRDRVQGRNKVEVAGRAVKRSMAREVMAHKMSAERRAAVERWSAEVVAVYKF